MVVCYLFATLFCEDKFRMCDDKSRMKSFHKRPFFIMHVIIFVYLFMHDVLSSYGEEDLHKYNLPCAFAFQRKTSICTSSREPLQLMKTIPYPLQFHRLYSPLKTSTSLSSITKKGDTISASSATPSWFWSINDKPG